LKVFWNKINYFIVLSLNYGYESGDISSTHMHGITTCVSKEGKNKYQLNNWIPRLLLNATQAA
jgi:hypothetical protein